MSEDYKTWTVPYLRELLKERGVTGYSRLKKEELVSIAEGRANPPAPSPRGRRPGAKSAGPKQSPSETRATKSTGTNGVKTAKTTKSKAARQHDHAMMTVKELKDELRRAGVTGYSNMKKEELVAEAEKLPHAPRATKSTTPKQSKGAKAAKKTKSKAARQHDHAMMTVYELKDELRRAGVTGYSNMKKEELVAEADKLPHAPRATKSTKSTSPQKATAAPIPVVVLPTLNALRERAKALNIIGRSTMNYDELTAAINEVEGVQQTA
jgi:predicted HTH domain antitoxin